MIETALLEAMRAQLTAMQAQLEVIAVVLGIHGDYAPQPVECAHAETEEVGTFGSPVLVCKACGAHV